ncbi:nuclear transport factor 2 family protein [Pendulispora brunnea]|uniref:Nuclear transport factor 2 family protein n=1 Tax=Pendulispora brunnea TaxID=2905690 RepID=A0ABZ2KCC6_9BACT
MPISRNIAALAAGVMTLTLLDGSSHAATPAEQAVLAPFQATLDGIAKRDKAMIRAQLLPGGNATLLREGGRIVQLPFEAFVEKLPSTGSERLEERIYNPLIRIDDNIAVIWASYDFFIDGKVDHCGTDMINLVKRDGRWLVSGITDNSRKNCPSR